MGEQLGGKAKEKMVLRENLKEPAILAGLAVSSNRAAAAAVARWECGNPRSVRVPKLRGRGGNVAVRVPSFRHRSVISTANPRFSSILARLCCLASSSAQNVCLSESRVK